MIPKHFLSVILVALLCLASKADVIIDDFNDNFQTSWYNSSSYQLTEANGEMRVVSNKTAYKVFQKGFARLDMSKHKVIQMRIKVYHNIAPIFRIDLEDANGYISNTFSTQVVTVADSQYAVYTFNFDRRFRQSYNSAGQLEHKYLDSTKIVKLTFHLNAPTTYVGTIYMDDIVLLGAQPKELIAEKSSWKFHSGAAPASDWTDITFDDASWASDTAAFGFGDSDVYTTTDFGSDPDNKYTTYWFRKKFSVVDKAIMKALILELLSDDGIVAYLNGTEVFRNNLPAGTISETTFATAELDEAQEVWNRLILDSNALALGDNLLAVEMHLSAANDVDMLFDARFNISSHAPGLVRGPYLQCTGSNTALIRWRTLEPSVGRVLFGTDLNNMNLAADSLALVTEHKVRLSNLSPATKYFYALLKANGDTIVGADSSHYFITHPTAGAEVPIRAWITGDAGKENKEQRDMRDAYVNATQKKHTDLWLLLGDNAYNEGTDEEYQYAMFQDMFEEQMKHTALFPSPGNHDLRNYVNNLAEAPYYQIFSTPQDGESGGVPSNSQAYYSFDYGNVHFISLDSYGTPRDSTEIMATWLKNDLANTTARWKVAFWHHPPYTKGSHDSDLITNSNDNNPSGKSRLFEMREQILPILEKAGIDLVLCGHSHVYERSYLLHGHYGVSSTFNDEPHVVNGVTSGKKSLNEEYRKNPVDPAYPNIGTVYAVVGCSGLKSQSISGWPLSQIMHFSSASHVGSMVLEVHKDTLTAKFLTLTGLYPDEFTIIKDNSQPISLVTSKQYGKSETSDRLMVYPNPAQDKISLNYAPAVSGSLQIELYDNTGKLIKKILSESTVPGSYHQEFMRGGIKSGHYKIIMKLNGKIAEERSLVLE